MTRFEARVRELLRQLDADGHFRYLLARIQLKKHANPLKAVRQKKNEPIS